MNLERTTVCGTDVFTNVMPKSTPSEYGTEVTSDSALSTNKVPVAESKVVSLVTICRAEPTRISLEYQYISATLARLTKNINVAVAVKLLVFVIRGKFAIAGANVQFPS